MKIKTTLTLCMLALGLAACSSKQAPQTAAVELPVTPPWADQRMARFTELAASQGYELEREGEQIRLIIPVDGNFHPKRTLLLPSGLVPLSKVAQTLRDDHDTQLAVVGHSDSVGDDALNKQLSMERAQAVASVLMLGGVSGQRLQLGSMGENQPRAENTTDSGRAKNRRVEIVLMPYPTRLALAD